MEDYSLYLVDNCWCIDCSNTTTNAKGYCDDCLEHNCQQD